MRFDNYSYKIELRNKILCKVNGKGEKKHQKNSNGLAEKALPCGNGSYNFEKDTNYTKRKRKVDLIAKNEKRSKQWGEEIRLPTSE